MQYYIAGIHGALCILFSIGAIQSESGVAFWPVLFASVAIAGPFYIRWRYVSPVFLSEFGVETPDTQVPWSAIQKIRIWSTLYPFCYITYEEENGCKLDKIAGIALPSEALPSQVLIRWQRASGRDAVEKYWSLLRGHVVRNTESA